MKNTHLIFFTLLLVKHGIAAPNALDSLVVSSTESSEANAKESVSTAPAVNPNIYEMNIRTNVSNRFAKTLVVSKVKNSANSAKEATFTVILPEKAFISEFVMETGGKSYKAYVKEKEEAKNIYNQAVSSGLSAGHVAVSARDSNRFTVSINIEPESKASFLLTYEELLERKYGQYELVLNIHPGQIVKELNVEVHINESRPLKFVKTPSLRTGNEISKNKEQLDPSSDINIINSTNAIVKFSPGLEKQKEFARGLGTKEDDGLSGQFVVQYDVERDPHGGEVLLQDGYFVHFFAPTDLKPLPKHVVFVLDTSGSMWGTKIEQLKDAMNSILSEIKKGDKLTIIEFNSEIIVWDINAQNKTRISYGYEENYYEPFNKLSKINLPAPVKADGDTIDKAKDVVKKIDSDGGTNMIGGLETALYLIKQEQERSSNKNGTSQPIIIFLTDGQPNEGIYSTEKITEIATKLNFENNKVPIFSLSFGYGADKEFLRKLSLKNLGFSRHIYEASDASLQLQEFYKQISSPLLSNINFKYESKVQEVTKSRFPIYFEGSELIVAGKYEDESFRAPARCWAYEGPINLEPVVEKSATSLERLWAYLTIKQTLEERDSAENKTELTNKALNLALKYSFVTDVTSLVVVKPNDTNSQQNRDGIVSTADRPRFSGGYGYGQGGPVYGPSSGPLGRSFYASWSGPSGYHPGSAGAPIPQFRSVSSSLYAGRIATPRMPISFSGSRGSPILSNIVPNIYATSTTSSVLTKLENSLPWLASVLSPNRTISISSVIYELGENSASATNTECPKTPLNTTDTGICTLLRDCPEVYSLLTDFQVYEKYFCPVDNKYAGVCCPKKSN